MFFIFALLVILQFLTGRIDHRLLQHIIPIGLVIVVGYRLITVNHLFTLKTILLTIFVVISLYLTSFVAKKLR
ncbi:hypothetical protein R4Y45_00535 [Holzapfeliella sp. He02]|uniref:Uncharacterized protein n=1 Tax=Holzapfeliella saturejae TaxID=3082953 RepID=A0ABU8SFQ9_9LACO